MILHEMLIILEVLWICNEHISLQLFLENSLIVKLMKITRLKLFSPLDCLTFETIILDYLVYAFLLIDIRRKSII
jgi:uncharacterized membrane protein YwzB